MEEWDDDPDSVMVHKYKKLCIKDAAYRRGENLMWCKVVSILATRGDSRVCVQVADLQGALVDTDVHFDVPDAEHTSLPVRTVAGDAHFLPATALQYPIMVLHFCAFDRPLLRKSAPVAYYEPCAVANGKIQHNGDNPYHIVNTLYLHAARYRDGVELTDVS